MILVQNSSVAVFTKQEKTGIVASWKTLFQSNPQIAYVRNPDEIVVEWYRYAGMGKLWKVGGIHLP